MKVIKHKDKWYLQSDTGYKEILLSTDTELQKNGIQAIDDEFLEWFVKNPSCEWVEVESMINMIQFTPREFIYKIKQIGKYHFIFILVSSFLKILVLLNPFKDIKKFIINTDFQL